MIRLPSGSLVFELAGGQDIDIPCSAEAVQFELAGDLDGLVDSELFKNAAVAVLHYFKHELHRTSVSVAEFSAALEKVLHGFGLTYVTAGSAAANHRPLAVETNLATLVFDGLELLFYQRLRDELRRQLQPAPRVIRFHGLRDCVKQLAGAKRWNGRCQGLSDQIVEFLRTSLRAEGLSKPCGLVVT